MRWIYKPSKQNTKRIICKCGRKLIIVNPWKNRKDHSGKSHAHCKCGLEWHWSLSGKIYSHKRK